MSNEVTIVVSSRDETGPGMDGATRRAHGLKGTLQKVGETAAGFLAANVVAKGFESFKGFIDGSVEAASNLGEGINAVQKIFGDSSPEVLAWGKANATAFGLSQRAFNDLATPLGAGLKNAGFSMKQTADHTIELTKRAADMASVFNTSVPDALEAIQSGLRGEADPLERYGVGLSAAKVQAEALSETHKKSAKSLTSVELATARVGLIMKQTASTAGDFTQTSGGLANAQRIAAAKTEELQAKIGQRLQPVILAVTQAKLKLTEVVADKLLPAFNKVADWLGKNPAALKALGVVVGVILVTAFVAWAASAAAAAAATIAATWPILAIIAVVAALAAGFVWLYHHSETFRKGADALGRIIRDTVWPALKGFGEFIGKTLVAYLKFMVNAWLTVVGALLSGAAKAFGWIPGIGPKLKAASKEFNKFKDEVNAALNGVQTNKEITFRARVTWAPGSGDVFRAAQGGPGQGLGVLARQPAVKGHAAGGVAGGLAEVGEYGRELVRLPYGSMVYPHGQSETMLARGAGSSGGGPMNIILKIGDTTLGEILVDPVRRAVRARGGSVQAVLGS